uniref:Uncharacterized protein n=1 Tax=Glossina austeni TaxID=7395 RepID=A0A1A9VDR4_GLOAU
MQTTVKLHLGHSQREGLIDDSPSVSVCMRFIVIPGSRRSPWQACMKKSFGFPAKLGQFWAVKSTLAFEVSKSTGSKCQGKCERANRGRRILRTTSTVSPKEFLVLTTPTRNDPHCIMLTIRLGEHATVAFASLAHSLNDCLITKPFLGPMSNRWGYKSIREDCETLLNLFFFVEFRTLQKYRSSRDLPKRQTKNRLRVN